ncbi:ABC transporter ATP-binding protein [Candidatus Poribacteria bacterium]|nr:ABC transporter ATP-binding protein [Candidatus Poribacteria bacterium]
MMRLLEQMPDTVSQKIQDVLTHEEEELIRVSTDLNPDGTFGEQWLIATDRRVIVVPAEGVDGVVDVPIRELAAVQTESLVGGGRLEIDRKKEATLFVPYSSSLAEKFSEVALGLEQLRQQDEFLISTELDQTRCSKCGRLLPEKNGICTACIRRLATLGRIASYLIPYKGRAVLLALISLVTIGADLLPPLVMRQIVDNVFLLQGETVRSIDQRAALLGQWILVLIGLRILSWSMELAHGWIVSWLSARMTADIRSHLYRRLEMLTMQFYSDRRVGALMSRVTRDSDMLREFLVNGLPYLVINILKILAILGILFWMHWQLTLCMLLPVPFIIIWGRLFWRRMRRIFNKHGQSWAHLSARLNEAFAGIHVVKAFAQEVREIGDFEKKNTDLMRISRRTARHWLVFFAVTSFLTGCGGIIIWLVGGSDMLRGNLTLGTLTAFSGYMWQVYGPLEWLSRVNSWMTRAFAGAERIFEVIDASPEAYDDPEATALAEIKGQVTFKDVTFGYDKSKPVLHEVDLDVAPGEMVGLVGKSGVGKTTTVNLIVRFYDVDRGAIEIDGVDVRNLRLEDLRSQIGIVLQEPFLFSGTIAENIGYGNPGATFEEIMQAAQAANAHNFIVAKADGYDTNVGERGNSLSGGEKQRVSIARAILHNPKILILDEATSSVDVETEKEIQEAVARLVKNRTTFAIAHRLSTLRNANRLVVLDAGRIVEVGTHSELMAKKGAFYDLVELQQQTSEIIGIRE